MSASTIPRGKEMFLNGLTRWQGWGITFLRVVVGIVFVMHGGQKLFSYGMSGTAGFMSQVGIPAPWLAAVVVTAVEFLGGLALLFGLLTRVAALLLAMDMLVAILTVTLPKGFFLPQGYEFTLTLLAATVALVLTGPGKASLDAVLATRGT
jgi:putative oxidoreductase